MSSVSNGLYFLTLPLVRVMRVINRKIRHARYLYIKRNVEKVWGARYTLGARYLSKNTVLTLFSGCQGKRGGLLSLSPTRNNTSVHRRFHAASSSPPFSQRLRKILYAFFWVIPWRQNFIRRRFGVLCSIFIGG